EDRVAAVVLQFDALAVARDPELPRIDDGLDGLAVGPYLVVDDVFVRCRRRGVRGTGGDAHGGDRHRRHSGKLLQLHVFPFCDMAHALCDAPNLQLRPEVLTTPDVYSRVRTPRAPRIITDITRGWLSAFARIVIETKRETDV